MEEIITTNFNDVLGLIKQARNNALKIVNTSLIEMYMQVGQYISSKVETGTWGKGVVVSLAEFIKNKGPEIQGFTARNIWRMKQFYEAYKDFTKLSPLVTQLSWTNNLIILTGCKNETEREFYLKLAISQRYSKRELERQIATGAFERTKFAKANMSNKLIEMTAESPFIFKDSYVLEFLGLPEKHTESDLQKSLIQNLKLFILELGGDFSFIGEQFRLQVGNEDFYIDLLFYHRTLQCLVAFELKIDKFRPEHMGQLEFYLEALDRDVKKEQENPSIGILLCAYKDKDVVEYALSITASPALIAEYETKLISKKVLQKKLHELYMELDIAGDKQIDT